MKDEERRKNWSEAYRAYHAQVVDACVRLFHGRSRDGDGTAINDDDIRNFFDHQCDYFESFNSGEPPEECAEAQWEACT